MKIKVAVLAFCLLAGPAAADEKAVLQALLDDFLSNAHLAAAHERFWAEDLVYTSSRGTRTTRAEILAGIEEPQPGTVPDTSYFAEEVDIRVYDDAAVVAFKLVGDSNDVRLAGQPDYYFNTGTFVKRDGEWRAVAWQATVIPGTE